MTGHSYVPDEGLRASTDTARWAAEFTSRAWWDPGFALDQENVELWLCHAVLAFKTAELEQAEKNLARLKRVMLICQLCVFAWLALAIADIVLRATR